MEGRREPVAWALIQNHFLSVGKIEESEEFSKLYLKELIFQSNNAFHNVKEF